MSNLRRPRAVFADRERSSPTTSSLRRQRMDAKSDEGVGTKRKSAGYSPTLDTPERIRTSGLWFRSLFLTLPVLAFQPFSWPLVGGFCPFLARVATIRPPELPTKLDQNVWFSERRT